MKLKDGKKKRWRDDTPPEKEEKKEDVITIDDCKKEVYEPDNYREWGALGNKKEVIWYDKETSEKINLIIEFDQQKSLFCCRTHESKDYEPKAFKLTTDNDGSVQNRYKQQERAVNDLKNQIESTFDPIKEIYFDINRYFLCVILQEYLV